MSLLRIRHIATPGGMQYAIKFLHYGAEGSGHYFPMSPSGYQQLRDYLMCFIDRYHNKPLPYRLSDTLKKRMKERYHGLCLFALPKKEDV